MRLFAGSYRHAVIRVLVSRPVVFVSYLDAAPEAQQNRAGR